jgi:hypothetical protein
MGILTQSADLVYTLRFLRLLTTDWKDTNAFKLGLIDEEGNKVRKAKTTEEKSAYNMFHRLVFNVKKLINKAPGGKSRIASYASALYLIKEQGELSDEALQTLIDNLEIDTLDCLDESTWFLTEDRMLSPGTYSLDLSSDKVLNGTLEELCSNRDSVLVDIDTYPAGEVCGIDIYEVVHKPTNKNVYVTVGELKR